MGGHSPDKRLFGWRWGRLLCGRRVALTGDWRRGTAGALRRLCRCFRLHWRGRLLGRRRRRRGSSGRTLDIFDVGG
ncbi:MAG: hypothetical protein CMJ65_03145 [Planctomycetaceae bacterium]|nr:hypothetical protein [Planctomycetaceae bacterium]